MSQGSIEYLLRTCALSLVVTTACGGSAQRDGAASGQGGGAGAAGTHTGSGGAGTSGGSSSGGSRAEGGSRADGGSGAIAGLAQAGVPSAGGAAGEPGWTFERPVCGGSSTPGNILAFCGGPVTFAAPLINDTDGDGIVRPGDLLKLLVRMTNETYSSLAYPCLGLAVEAEGATLPLDPAGDPQENPIFSGMFALVSGSYVDYEFYARLHDDVAPGTTVRFLAWADALNSGCPSSGELEFEIAVE